jgi:N-acetylmuramoyl-L-alanine amidase
MSSGNPGRLGALARDAATVLGTVVLLTGLGMSAHAEPAEDPSQAVAGPTQAPAETGPGQSGQGNSSSSEDAFRAREIQCLAEAIYYEARGEPRRGQMAVAEVVANRVRSRAYPNTFCGVVNQRSTRVCQFSWVCDGRRAAPRGAPWSSARDIATQVVDGWDPGVVGNATHFHSTAVAPSWSRVYRRVAQIGSHIFYSPAR